MWTIHQPKPRAASPQTFHFLNDPPNNTQSQHQLPTPSSSPDPRSRPPARRLTIPDLVSTDEHFGKGNALQTALDTLDMATPPGDAVLTFNDTGDGDCILSARPWEVDECRRVNQELWERLDNGRSRMHSPAPTCGPAVQPAALLYLTPPSSPEPVHKYNLAPTAHTEPPNVPEPIVSTDYARLFDCPANRTPTFESAEYLSDWDDFGEDDECAVDSLDTPAYGTSSYTREPISGSYCCSSNGSFINPKHPVYPTAAMGVSPYDLSTMSGSNIKDLTSQLDLSSFPEWPIARGGFGEVWKGALALNKEKPRPIAVKRLTMYTATGDEGIKKIAKRTKKELSIWSSLSHENILPLLGTCLFRGGVGIVSEWQDNGNAIDWVRANPGVDRLKLCGGICSGLKYLHNRQVVHGDLRGANVLISKSGQPRLIDFGLASVTGSNAFSVSSTLAGTVRWMAPELQVTERQGTTVEGDIFAFGMTALELFTGLPPFENVNNDIAVLLKYQKGERPSRPLQAKRSNRGGDRTRDVCAPMDNETWDLVEECWSQDPLSRPTADSILEWFMQKKKRRECDLRVSGGVEFVLDTGYQTDAVL